MAKIMKGLWSLFVKSGPGDSEPLGRNENRARESEEDQGPVLRGRLNQESDEW